MKRDQNSKEPAGSLLATKNNENEKWGKRRRFKGSENDIEWSGWSGERELKKRRGEE